MINNKIKSVVIILVLFMLVGCNTNAEQTHMTTEEINEYSSTIYIVGLGINMTSVQNLALCQDTSEFWSDAINNGKDFNEAILQVQKIANDAGFLKKLSEDKIAIDKMMNQLNNPPEEYKELYSKLLDFYGQYTKLYNLATSPTGSLVSYNQSVNNIDSEIKRLYNELQVLIPQDIIKQVQTNKQ